MLFAFLDCIDTNENYDYEATAIKRNSNLLILRKEGISRKSYLSFLRDAVEFV